MFSVFLSFSQARGKPKPFWFGFPLVFFSSCTRNTTTIRTSSSSPTLKPRPVGPHFFCIFFLRRRSSFSGLDVFLVLVLLALGFLVGVFASGDLAGSRLCCSIAVTRCIMHSLGFEEGEEDYHLPPLRSSLLSRFQGRRMWNSWPARYLAQYLAGLSTPLTSPFQPNAIKDGPGRGRG